LDYAMSVIIDRALPDARDGLKPAHRRILVTLNDLGLKPRGRFRKSAKICGDVSGNYHPHGEAIVYPSMVHLAQTFKMRYPLVDSQGNFGSIDGDRPAAMRYTEARMKVYTEETLKDLYKDTVPWRDNYDGTRREPVVLPGLFPALILNGTIGIAVGMATNIPPHNLGEVIDALIYLIDHREKATVEDLMRYIKGPDFPTGGRIYDQKEIKQAYALGKGSIVMRARTQIRESRPGGHEITVTELPYQVNKATLIEKIAELVKNKKIQGIRDIRDESDRQGIRLVIFLKKDAYPQKVLNRLFVLTQLQSTFHVNMLALVDGIQPRVLPLEKMLECYLDHRFEVVSRRSEFELAEAHSREHILEGLKRALDKLDQVITTIRKSRDKALAQKNLIKKFKFTDKQAAAILEMRLSSLAGLERKKVLDELREKKALIVKLKGLLASKKRIWGVVKKELEGLKEKYADPRRTRVFKRKIGEFSEEDLVADEETIVTLTRGGYIKRMQTDVYRAQSRGGKGISSQKVKAEDVVDYCFTTTTHSNLYFFTDRGRVFQIRTYEIPESSRTARGQLVVNFIQIGADEKVTAVVDIPKKHKFRYLVMATRGGVVKKTKLEEYVNVRPSGLVAIRLRKGDVLEWVEPSTGFDEVILATKAGQAIRFLEKDARPMGRAAAGVKGITLREGDQMIAMEIIPRKYSIVGFQVLVVTENGYGKRTPLKFYKVQRRGGKGLKTAKVTAKNGNLVAMKLLGKEERDLILISSRGQIIRIPAGSISEQSRATQGVTLMRFKDKDKDKVANVTWV